MTYNSSLLFAELEVIWQVRFEATAERTNSDQTIPRAEKVSVHWINRHR